ncbi:pesticin C-terminus-like muramidase [Acidithiobacillus sulfuriphilus]|uniref:pesticin C-terminus-like muramidase n=1 Tax=Acidithiobacillus sulfuriphilus TaxID=1867749 RepID=UPI003F5E3E0B
MRFFLGRLEKPVIPAKAGIRSIDVTGSRFRDGDVMEVFGGALGGIHSDPTASALHLRHPGWHSEAGASAVEFAIAAPALLLALLGTFQAALFYQARAQLEVAAQEAVRAGTLHEASLAVLNTCFYPDRPAKTAPVPPTPGAAVCAKGNKVDFAFIKKNEGAMLDFYVPGYHATDIATGRNLGKAKPNKAKNGKESEPQPIQNSGVTVGVGVDLGQQTEDSLRRAMHQEAKDYGKPDDVKIDDILEVVKPFLSPLRRMDAVNALEDHKKKFGKYPRLTSAEARFLSSAVQHDYAQQAADVFNKSQRQEPPMDFWTLPAEAQTVLTDITYHHGRGGLTRVRSLLHQGKWQEAVDKLRQIAPSSGFKERMLKRATLLQKAIDGGSLPKDGNPCAPKQAAADRRTALWERMRRLWWA